MFNKKPKAPNPWTEIMQKRKLALQEYYHLLGERDKITKQIRQVNKELATWDRWLYTNEGI